VVVWGVGSVVLVVELVVRSIVFGEGGGAVVFSMFRGFAISTCFVVVCHMVVVLGVM
jgi:hypothetical protein